MDFRTVCTRARPRFRRLGSLKTETDTESESDLTPVGALGLGLGSLVNLVTSEGTRSHRIRPGRCGPRPGAPARRARRAETLAARAWRWRHTRFATRGVLREGWGEGWGGGALGVGAGRIAEEKGGKGAPGRAWKRSGGVRGWSGEWEGAPRRRGWQRGWRRPARLRQRRRWGAAAPRARRGARRARTAPARGRAETWKCQRRARRRTR